MVARNTAEGGTNGATLVLAGQPAGNVTPFSVVSSGTSNTCTYDTGSAFHGLLGYLVTKTVQTNASVYELRDGAGTADFTTQVYYRLTSLPSANGAGLGVQIRNTADAQQGGWRLTSTGLLQLINQAGTQVGIGTVALSTATYYRFEYRIDASLNWNVAAYTADGGTPVDTASAAGVSIVGTIDRARVGNTGGSAMATFSFDDPKLVSGSSAALGVPLQSITLGAALETDTAQPLGRVKARTLGAAAETDTARVLARVKARTLGAAAETDTARSLGRQKLRILGVATETNTAGHLTQPPPPVKAPLILPGHRSSATAVPGKRRGPMIVGGT